MARQRNGEDAWHFCTNCTWWPTSGYREVPGRDGDGSGELCNQCLGKEGNNACTPG